MILVRVFVFETSLRLRHTLSRKPHKRKVLLSTRSQLVWFGAHRMVKIQSSKFIMIMYVSLSLTQTDVSCDVLIFCVLSYWSPTEWLPVMGESTKSNFTVLAARCWECSGGGWSEEGESRVWVGALAYNLSASLLCCQRTEFGPAILE
jgi:hypothetical protein